MLLSGIVRDRMATINDGADMSEACAECGRETPHAVSVQIQTESDKSENAAFSREPYRVSECRICGATTQTRMNNA
jgi:ribosomal protein L37AE/L43A